MITPSSPTVSIPNAALPSLPVLSSEISPSLDEVLAQKAAQIAQGWFDLFREAISAHPNPAELVKLLLPHGVETKDGSPAPLAFWRDMLALTWDFRTFTGQDSILQFVRDRLTGKVAEEEVQLNSLELIDGPVPTLNGFNGTSNVQNVKASTANSTSITASVSGLPPTYIRSAPDVAWIQFFFQFKTRVAINSGIVRIVPVGVTNEQEALDLNRWKAHIVFTNLEGLLEHPENVGFLRNSQPDHGLWEAKRKAEVDYRDKTPTVIIIGAGQSGLDVAVRLKALGINSLIVERNGRVGDNWRSRYEALCLHDPVWFDHMPYLPFPPSWPVYSPAVKLANWLEHYAEVSELNIWLSSTVTSLKQDSTTGEWSIDIRRGLKDDKSGTEEVRKFTGVKHVIFATGLGSGVPNTPEISGADLFKKNGGTILHSSEHKKASDHAGKKVVVVGACNSAHDICADYYNNGVDVTMFQRSSTYVMSTHNGWAVLFNGLYSEDAPPVSIADRLSASFPNWASIPFQQRNIARIAELDADLLDRLHQVGFRTNSGLLGTGFTLNIIGGYYFDTGASGLIADGKIKLKNDAQIKQFNERGLLFDNGSELEADIVLFATGIGDPREHIRRIAGDSVYNRVNEVWGLDQDGEIKGAWRDLGVKGLWYMIGNLGLCRFHSLHVALQIKAIEEGLFGTRYPLKK